MWLSTEMGSLPNWTVQAHGEGTTADEILNYLSSEFRMTVRPNTLVPRCNATAVPAGLKTAISAGTCRPGSSITRKGT